MSIDAAVQALVQQTVSAMLPQIVQAVQGQLQAAAPAELAQVQPVVQAQPAADPFATLGAPAAVTQVTADMVQSLIMPLISNEAVKAQLSAEMQAMGIATLPDARPDQLPELYKRFQRVAAGAGANASVQSAPAATAMTII